MDPGADEASQAQSDTGRGPRAGTGGAARPRRPSNLAPLRDAIGRMASRLEADRRGRRHTAETCVLLTQVLESISDAFVALDARWRYVYVNANAGALFGRDPDSLIGRHIWTEFPEGVGQPFHLAYERVLATGQPERIETYYPPWDRWYENRIYPCHGGLAIFFQDVTAFREVAERLRESEGFYRAIIEQSLAGVYIIQDGRYRYVNPRFCEMVGYSAEELLALPDALDLVHPEDRAFVADRLRRRLAGEAVPPSRLRLRHRDGGWTIVEAHSRSVEMESGTVLVGFQIDVTDREQAEEELRLSEARFRAMIEHASDAITIVDARGTVRYASPSSERIFGNPADARLGRPGFDTVHPEDIARVSAMFHTLATEPGQTFCAQFRARHADGTWRHVEAVAQNLLEHPGVRGIVVNTRDVSARVEAEEALRRSMARFRTLVEQSPEAIVLHREQRLLYLNPAGAALLGVPDTQAVVGRSILDFLHPQSAAEVHAHLERGLPRDDERPVPFTFRAVRQDDGRVLDVEVTSVRGTYDGRTVVQSHLHDVTERKRLEEQLTHQAFHDSLTGLANRQLFRDRVEHALPRIARGEHMAVVLLDLDDFKNVNDSLGHAAGDELLGIVAARLAHAARGSDTVARFGGDEFAVVLEGLAHDEDVRVVLDRIRATLGQTATVGGREMQISASFGVAVGHGTENADDLVRNADVAMYRAKAEGKGRYAIFAPEMHAAALARLELEADLRGALARGEFRLVFQPLVELATGRVVGAEALLRWEHPRYGTVAPGAFITVAEQTGLIVPLGRWVLAEACREARRWLAAPSVRTAAALRVTVNISGRQLQEPEFTSHVEEALAESTLEPSRLVLEITESVMLHDAEGALAKLSAIRELGAQLAIDDFGTGYSSLSYLQRFPINVLKLDKSFTDELGTAAGEPALFRAIMALGHSLGMNTVAEGIETELQFERLRELGCEYGQGFLLAEPLLPPAFLELLRQRRTAASRQPPPAS